MKETETLETEKPETLELDYLGHKRTITVGTYKNLPTETIQLLREAYNKKNTKTDVLKDFMNLKHKQKTSNPHAVMKYYFRELINNTTYTQKIFSINELMDNDTLVKNTLYSLEKYYNVHTEDYKTEFSNEYLHTFQKVVSMYSSYTKQITNFSFKDAKSILSTYNVNNKYYDYSCGWGIRCLASITSDIKYFGTDPNYKLVQKIEEMVTDYKKACDPNKDLVELYPQGSEIFIPSLENSIGLAFSSPPYFDLEDYKVGEQSIKDRNYDKWLEEYWRPTVKNIKKYLIDDGFMLLQIKNTQKYNMLDDMDKICKEEGLFFKEDFVYEPTQRNYFLKLGEDELHLESVYVYVKTEENINKKMINDIDEWL